MKKVNKVRKEEIIGKREIKGLGQLVLKKKKRGVENRRDIMKCT